MDGVLYGLEAGAGCSHGLAGTDNTIFRVNTDGTTTTVADLSAFIKAHPVANPDLGDFEPDGTWYSMVAVRGAFYATEPNHQEFDQITLNGTITRLSDMSTLFVPPDGWQGPTGPRLPREFLFRHACYVPGSTRQRRRLQNHAQRGRSKPTPWV